MEDRQPSSRSHRRAPALLTFGQGQRLGFLAGEIEVPDDFDRMGEAEIAQAFGIEG